MRDNKKLTRFKFGKNANKSLSRKLLTSFIFKGKIKATQKKTKLIKFKIDNLVNLAKKNTQVTQTKLLKTLADEKAVRLLIEQIAPVFKEKTGGFTKLKKFHQRDTDGAYIAQIEWSLPIVLEVKKPKEKPEQDQEKKQKSSKVKIVKK